jgi:hypothetical protein
LLCLYSILNNTDLAQYENTEDNNNNEMWAKIFIIPEGWGWASRSTEILENYPGGAHVISDR